MKLKKIKKYVEISFFWNGIYHRIILIRKDFNCQLDRFYAYFDIGKEHFYFEDSLESKEPVIEQPGVWHKVDEDHEDYYHRNVAVLKVA